MFCLIHHFKRALICSVSIIIFVVSGCEIEERRKLYDLPPEPSQNVTGAMTTLKAKGLQCPEGRINTEGTDKFIWQFCVVPAHETIEAHGPYLVWREFGISILREGRYIWGDLTGLEHNYYEKGAMFSRGRYQEGLRVGVWEYWYENQVIMATENYRNGKLEGMMHLWHENGKRWKEATFENGKLEGIATEYDPAGYPFREYYYQRGKREGRYRRWSGQYHLVAEGEFQADLWVGTLTLYYPYKIPQATYVFDPADESSKSWVSRYTEYYERNDSRSLPKSIIECKRGRIRDARQFNLYGHVIRRLPDAPSLNEDDLDFGAYAHQICFGPKDEGSIFLEPNDPFWKIDPPLWLPDSVNKFF